MEQHCTASVLQSAAGYSCQLFQYMYSTCLYLAPDPTPSFIPAFPTTSSSSSPSLLPSAASYTLLQQGIRSHRGTPRMFTPNILQQPVCSRGAAPTLTAYTTFQGCMLPIPYMVRTHSTAVLSPSKQDVGLHECFLQRFIPLAAAATSLVRFRSALRRKNKLSTCCSRTAVMVMRLRGVAGSWRSWAMRTCRPVFRGGGRIPCSCSIPPTRQPWVLKGRWCLFALCCIRIRAL